jgi:hypothetical protein
MDIHTFGPVADEAVDKIIAFANEDEKTYDLSMRGWMDDLDLKDQIRHIIKMAVYDGINLFLKNATEDNKS